MTEALEGPLSTLVETPRAKPPASACQQRRVRQLRPVALDGDVQVVLQRQRDRILQGEIEVAGAQQRIQAR